MASTITYSTKSNNSTLPSVPATQKVSAADLNEIKTVVNTNAGETDTNAANISTNTANISALQAATTPGTSNSTAIDLTNLAGVTHSDSGAAMSDTTFTLASSPVEMGFAVIYSNAASTPTITGATAHTNFATDYQTGADNLILVTYINGVARYSVYFF